MNKLYTFKPFLLSLTFLAFLTTTVSAQCITNLSTFQTAFSSNGDGTCNYTFNLMFRTSNDINMVDLSIDEGIFGSAADNLLVSPGVNNTIAVTLLDVNCGADVTISVLGDGASCAGNASNVVFTGSVPLPIELTYFSGRSNGNMNEFTWETATEDNTHYFVLERSLRGRDFEGIAKSGAVGFSETPQAYTLTDQAPPAEAYYRLRSVDFDGYEQLSEVITISRVDSRRAPRLTAYPNPVGADGMLTFQFEVSQAGSADLIFTDLNGRVFHQSRMDVYSGFNKTQIELDQLTGGTYFVQIRTREEVFSQPIVVLDRK